MQNKDTFVRKIAYCVGLMSVSLICACGTTTNVTYADKARSSDTGFIVTKAGMYDSADAAAILVGKDMEAGTVTFYNRSMGREYTLNFNGTTKIYDKYGTGMSMEQVNSGCIADITFLKGKKLLNSMSMSSDAWVYDEVKDFSIDESSHEMVINGSAYKFDEGLHVYANAREATLMDVNPVDTISVCGLDRKVYSINVEEGHGYLRLKNEDYFVGGWIEVGSKIIRTINEDMLIAVPIGTYEVQVSNNGVDGVKTVTIDRNQETELDIGDLKQEEISTLGTLIIVTTPESAEVYIDGDKIDTSKPQKLEYGIHQMIAKATGYQTLTQYIKVGQESATLDVTLEKEIAPITPEPKITAMPSPTPIPQPQPVPTTIPANNVITTNTIEGYKVTVSAPYEVEVYVDGDYTGISPCDFTKVSGTHEITLRKDGYVTRSYTVSLDNSKRDESFSFSDLEEEE